MSSNTRERILDAMYELVAEVGYDKASIAAVCEKAGINKGSLYYFFKHKEQLFLTLIDEYLPQTSDVKEKLAKTDTIKEYKELLIYVGTERIDYYLNDKSFGKMVAELYIQGERIQSVKQKEMLYIQSVKERNALLIKYGETLGAFDKNKFNFDIYVNLLDVFLDGIETAIRYKKDMNYKEVWKSFIEGLIIE